MRVSACLSTVLMLGLFVPASALLAQEATAPVQTPVPAAQPVPSATPAPPQYTITRNVNLVVLDGVVIDAKGNAVTDLKQSDFQIEEDGQPQQIRNFEVPGATMPTPETDVESTADLDRLAPRAPVNIVLLDEFNTRFEDMAFARYSLKKWLEKQPSKLDTPTMLVAVDLQHFTVVRDYTQNKDELLAALDHHFAAYPWQVHQFSWVAERYSTALYSLRRVAEATVGHLGHKNMVWIGRGFPALNFSGITVDAKQQVESQVQLTINELRDARITLYTIDPAGVMIDPGVYGRAAQLYAPFGGDPGFESLARATGGRTFFGRNDVDAEIGSSIRDGSSLYTIAYHPTNTSDDKGTFRRIKVTLSRPGLTFITRQGYYPGTKVARPRADGTVNKRLASELFNAASSNMAYDAVRFTVKADANNANSLKIHIEPRGIGWYYTQGTKPRFTRIIVFSESFDRKGKLVKSDNSMVVATAPAKITDSEPVNLPIDIDYKLTPEAKAVRARLVVRVEASGHMGTADLTLAPGAVASSASAEGTDTTAPPAAPPSVAKPVSPSME